MKSLSLLIKPVSGRCNMRCRYCFYADVSDKRKERLSGVMSEDTLEHVVYNALRETTDVCVFGFQGGEPTLAGLEFYRMIIDFERKHNPNNITIRHSIQTNGLLLDDEWCSFLAQYNFLVGLSIDGPKDVHDRYRFDASGKETHNRCLRAARMLSKHRVDYNILTVVTRSLAAHPDMAFNFYKKHGFRHLQFIPCLDGLGDNPNSHDYSLDSGPYGDFLCRLFDLWYGDYVKNDYYSIRSFDNYVYMLAGFPPENCAACGICSVTPLIEADGSVYPCDFYALDDYLLGNVHTHSFQDMISGSIAESFVNASRHIHNECRNCRYYNICRGGCRRDRESYAGQPGLNVHCTAYKKFFSHALPRMAQLIKKPVPPVPHQNTPH